MEASQDTLRLTEFFEEEPCISIGYEAELLQDPFDPEFLELVFKSENVVKLRSQELVRSSSFLRNKLQKFNCKHKLTIEGKVSLENEVLLFFMWLSNPSYEFLDTLSEDTVFVFVVFSSYFKVETKLLEYLKKFIWTRDTVKFPKHFSTFWSHRFVPYEIMQEYLLRFQYRKLSILLQWLDETSFGSFSEMVRSAAFESVKNKLLENPELVPLDLAELLKEVSSYPVASYAINISEWCKKKRDLETSMLSKFEGFSAKVIKNEVNLSNSLNALQASCKEHKFKKQF